MGSGQALQYLKNYHGSRCRQVGFSPESFSRILRRFPCTTILVGMSMSSGEVF